MLKTILFLYFLTFINSIKVFAVFHGYGVSCDDTNYFIKDFKYDMAILSTDGYIVECIETGEGKWGQLKNTLEE